MKGTEQRAKATTLAALLTPVAVGLIYVGMSCERYSPGAGKCESQWVTAITISGLGGAWSAGFWQPNQALRERDRRLIRGEEPAPAGGDPGPDDRHLPDAIVPAEVAHVRDPRGLYGGTTEPPAGDAERFALDELRALVQLLEERRHG